MPGTASRGRPYGATAPLGELVYVELLRPERSRSFEVALQLARSGPNTSGTVQAAKSFADDLAYTGDARRNGGFVRNPERLSGLGDEAFAAQASNLIVSGRGETTAYDLGGAMVEVRRRNVVLTVKWRGADYPASVRGRQAWWAPGC